MGGDGDQIQYIAERSQKSIMVVQRITLLIFLTASAYSHRLVPLIKHESLPTHL